MSSTTLTPNKAVADHIESTVSVFDVFAAAAKAQATIASLRCYPANLTSLIKRALVALAAQPARPGADEIQITSVGDMESLGNSRYALKVTDQLGNTYRVAIEVLPR